MDQFKYQATLQHLSELTKVKDIEAELRKLISVDPKYVPYSSFINNFEHYKLTYKLARFALNKFESRSSRVLPDFIYEHLITRQGTFNDLIMSRQLSISYKQFIDIFEFNSTVTLNRTDINNVVELHNIILDLPIHFTFDFKNLFIHKFTEYSVNNSNPNFKYLINAVRLKQTISPDTPSTVLGSLINYYKNQLPAITDSIKANLLTDQTLLSQQLNAIIAVCEEYANV